MPIGIGGVSFEGPYSRHEMLCRRPGVFAVLDGRDLPPLHAEKTDDVRQAVEDHARRESWRERCDRPSYAVFYTAVDHNQRRVEETVREEYGLYEEHAAGNGRPAAGERPPQTNGRPAAENGRTAENGRPADDPAERPAEQPAAEAGENGRPDQEEERRPAAVRPDDRAFHFHVPAEPSAPRQARVS